MTNKAPVLWKQSILPLISLFTSMGTLLCCALPALLVTLGLGATLAGFVNEAPWIVSISKYKNTVFIFSGVLISIAGLLQWNARNAPCPIDPLQAKACSRLRKFSWVVLGLSVVLYLTGLFFSYIAIHIFY